MNQRGKAGQIKRKSMEERTKEKGQSLSLTLQEVFQLTKKTLNNRNISRKYPGAYQTGKALQFHLSQKNQCSP